MPPDSSAKAMPYPNTLPFHTLCFCLGRGETVPLLRLTYLISYPLWGHKEGYVSYCLPPPQIKVMILNNDYTKMGLITEFSHANPFSPGSLKFGPFLATLTFLPQSYSGRSFSELQPIIPLTSKPLHTHPEKMKRSTCPKST